ncbi:MAG TPA: hypothetical protein VFQ72_00880 [Candidatus Paceibacterota bacterium]|nr:hypothetical protein [Candidatus Paceibacterota bacterium]
MNSKRSLSVTSLFRLAVIGIVGAAATLLLALVLCRVLPFRDEAIAAVAVPYVIGTMVTAWAAFFSIAAAEYRFGLDGQARFACAAAIAAYPAIHLFASLFSHRWQDMSFLSLLVMSAYLALACGGMGILVGVYFVDMARAAGERFAPFFDRIFFPPS